MSKELQKRSLDEFKDIEDNDGKTGFDWESFIFVNRKSLVLFLVGLIFLGFGVIYYKVGGFGGSTKLEVIEDNSDDKDLEMVVEIAGAIEKPGVYKMSYGKRIDDLLVVSGGVTANADRDWMDKYLNRAALLTDAQKIYIPSISEQSNSESAIFSDDSDDDSGVLGSGPESLMNINTATLEMLDTLPGIGPVYGQSIIDHRPYSNVEDLLQKEALKENLYKKIKDLVTVY